MLISRHSTFITFTMQTGVIIFVINILLIEGRMILTKYEAEASTIDQESNPLSMTNFDKSQERFTEFKSLDREENDSSYETEYDRKTDEKIKKPCSMVVLSHIQNPSLQSLLRKYRYDANGILIPSSVKYFIKMPQGLKSSPLLVPLNDKSYSPLGSFVRYYKEVPPIPQAW
ncbi:uncharacterized protein LOC125050100 isoform X1 [Pieris napi]|uniref:uncharacterized protein LOC125050100 isoform X1 n=1 Tax=Pieris napi TaxID=78633 RepID=UPI001FB9EEDF|nr:uncharacterized protein LOC125050100 isoform X1 [Pieris napi]